MTKRDSEIQIPGYKIIKPLGYGGMATVYLAIQESVGREVAIKVMSPALASDPTFSERFVKEARMANLSHPNIITVYDAGVTNGQNYIVMELASGGNLDAAIDQGMSAARVVEIIKAIASALSYSSKKGVVHRDVKPENILLKEDGSPLLVDFGIAKAITSGTRLTMVGTTIGSPNYMSPEQARGLELDGRSDLYSLGIVFYEALTGIKPFDGPDTFVIGLRHINDPIPQLPDAYKKFQPVIDKLLAKKPEERFSDGTELIETLDSIPLDDIDYTVIPRDATERSSAETEVFVDDDSTRLSSDFSARETVVNEVMDDETRLMEKPPSSDETGEDGREEINDDATRVMPTEEKESEQKPSAVTPPTAKKSNAALYGLVTIVVLAVAGFVGWKMMQQAPVPPAPVIVEKPEPAIEEKKEEIKEVAPAPVIVPEVVKEPVVTEPEIDETAIKIKKYLKQARVYYKKKQLTTPENKSAFFMYGKVLALDANNAEAKQGLKNIADQYYQFASRRYDKKQFGKAKTYIKKGLSVLPDHKKLLALQQKIAAAELQAEQERKLAEKKAIKQVIKPKPPVKPEIKTIVPFIKKNSDIFNVAGNHFSTSAIETKYQSRISLMNKIYYLLLAQCNYNVKNFENHQCRYLYQNYIQQWPLKLDAVKYTEIKSKSIKRGKILLDKEKAKSSYQKAIKQYQSKIDQNDLSTKSSRLAIANGLLLQPVAQLMGLKTHYDLVSMWESASSVARHQSPRIKSSKTFIKRIRQMVSGKKVHITPFVSAKSFEITPFIAALYESLNQTVGNEGIESADYELRGQYKLAKSGDVLLDLWLFDKDDTVVDLANFTLDKKMKKAHRVSNIFYNDLIFPETPLRKSYRFPAALRIGKDTFNALLFVGDKTSLDVKLDNPGFYYIAVHVVRPDMQFSYLLPLKQAEVPFVQVALREHRYKFRSLGEFEITPPTGVETIQLIAASVNLDRYLPPYKWSDKYQQFIIEGSEGNVAAGIAQVRKMANQIPSKAFDKSVKWQERLLVTTILDRGQL